MREIPVRNQTLLDLIKHKHGWGYPLKHLPDMDSLVDAVGYEAVDVAFTVAWCPSPGGGLWFGDELLKTDFSLIL